VLQSHVVSRQKMQSFSSAEKRVQKQDIGTLAEVPNTLKLQHLNSNNLSVMSGQLNTSIENANRSPTTQPLNSSLQQVKVIPLSGQIKSAKSGSKAKSKERKNRMAQQPYILQSKAPQAYI